jgi:histidyl-tRNA synthetase
MARRTYILDHIRAVYRRYGFQPLETPSMENLSVLTGKYGDEGDQLLFKILNSGDFLSKTREKDYAAGALVMLPKIAEKGLRYDLTVPFARYVVMNQHEITFPFRRYQIQPVWRADRPQKGRYREFYQCDADVVGTDSLICEAEIVLMLEEVFDKLGLQDISIKINNRKILSGVVEVLGAQGKENDLLVAIDKLDKIGRDKVIAELQERGFGQDALNQLSPLFELTGSNQAQLDQLRAMLAKSEIGMQGVAEMEEVIERVHLMGSEGKTLAFDVTLARGLSYYTGAIFEVKANNVSMSSSISGGGRYDNLTGVFGMPGMSGVGISFGVDRIYDVMEELQLFPEESLESTQVLLISFDEATEKHALTLLSQLRKAGISAEIYPDRVKLKKQFAYADKKGIPFTLVIGSNEVEQQAYGLKNLKSGEQETLSLAEIIQRLKQ